MPKQTDLQRLLGENPDFSGADEYQDDIKHNKLYPEKKKEALKALLKKYYVPYLCVLFGAFLICPFVLWLIDYPEPFNISLLGIP